MYVWGDKRVDYVGYDANDDDSVARLWIFSLMLLVHGEGIGHIHISL